MINVFFVLSQFIMITAMYIAINVWGYFIKNAWMNGS